MGRRLTAVVLMVIMIFVSSGCSRKETAPDHSGSVNTEGRNMLILYFSWSGNVDKFAKIIQKETGADILRIEPEVPYSDEYDTVADYAKAERDNNERPAIRTEIDIEDYDIIFVGYPIWWYTTPMIINTLFDEQDFSGKTIVPFNSHEGSGDGGTYELIAQWEPDATVLPGLAIRGRDLAEDQTDTVREWLDEIFD